MGDPKKIHLSSEELYDYFDEVRRDTWMDRHLKICELCRDRLKDLRYVKYVVQEPDKKSHGHHIPPETLVAYQDNVLSVEQMNAVDDHLDGCDECLEDYIVLRRDVPEHKMEAPDSLLVEKTVAKLKNLSEPRPIGNIVAAKILEGYRLAFKPYEVPIDSDFAASYDMGIDFDEPLLPPEFDGAVSASIPGPEPVFGVQRESIPLDEDSGVSFLRMEAPMAPPPTEPVILTVGPLRLTLSAGEGLDKPTLNIEAKLAKSEKPAVGYVITLTPVRGKLQRIKTDMKGLARLFFPKGESKLEVEADGAVWSLDLRL